MEGWIMHVDMDAFFAAVEQRDNPELRGKPVIIGGLSGRGVVSTASYEARRYGVRSAMSMAEARRLCPAGVFLPPDLKKYSNVSKQLLNILSDFSPVVEPLSLDEAFLDMRGMDMLFPDRRKTACAVKERIKAELGLTASVGAAPNKFLAKLASDMGKPDGLVIISREEAVGVLKDMPVSRLWGVGAATEKILKSMGIRTIGDLAVADEAVLAARLGSLGHDLKRLALGQDDREVKPERQPKSIGNELTFNDDLYDIEQIKSELLALSERVGWRLRKAGLSGRTVTLKIRFASFRTITRSKTLLEAVNFDELIYQTALELYGNCVISEGIRLLGITISNLQSGILQLPLFDAENQKRAAVYGAVDKLKDRFGEGVITKGRLAKFYHHDT